MISHWNQRGSTISKRNWNQKYCHWFCLFVFFSVASVLWCIFSFYFSLCLKKLQSGLLFVVFASVSFVLLCTDDLFFTKIYSSVHARWSIAQFCLLHSFLFNYKSVAVCKINVHDYRTGKNSWVRTVHVTLFYVYLRYKTALSRDFSLVLYKNTFLCCAARVLLLFSLPKKIAGLKRSSLALHLSRSTLFFSQLGWFTEGRNVFILLSSRIFHDPLLLLLFKIAYL